MNHAERVLAEEFFAGRLPPDRFDQLFGHMRACNGCKGYFEEVRQGYRALGSSAAPLARHEADLLLRQLLAEAAPAPTPFFQRFWRPVAAGAVALAAGAAALAVAVRPADDGFAARGAPAVAPALVQALCLTRAGDAPVRPMPDARGQFRCAVGWFVMVAAAGEQMPAHLTVAALDASGRQVFLARKERPRPKDLLDGYIELREAGPLRLVALGTDAPLGEAEIWKAARECQPGGVHCPPGGRASSSAVLTIEVERAGQLEQP